MGNKYRCKLFCHGQSACSPSTLLKFVVSDKFHVPTGRQSHLAFSHTVQLRFYTTALLRGLSAAGQKNVYQKTQEDNESTDAKYSYPGSKAVPGDFYVQPSQHLELM